MAIFELGGHGELHELVVECYADFCTNFVNNQQIYPAGYCRKPKDITIGFKGECRLFKDSRELESERRRKERRTQVDTTAKGGR